MIIVFHHWNKKMTNCLAVSADTKNKNYSIKDNVYLTGSNWVVNYKATMKEVNQLIASCKSEGYKCID